jgi:hypothetical protein
MRQDVQGEASEFVSRLLEGITIKHLLEELACQSLVLRNGL